MQKPDHGWRELTTDEIKRLLTTQKHGRLGLCDNGKPYVVPLSYGYGDGVIYFHSARSGRKLDVIGQNNQACFEVDVWEKGWASVICCGRVTLRDDLEAKRKAFRLLMGADVPEERLSKLSSYIGVINIEQMTGRCSADFQLN